MLKTSESDVKSVVMALLANTKETAECLSQKGVAEIAHSDPSTGQRDLFVLFHLEPKDIGRMGDCFFITIEGASEAFGDKAGESDYGENDGE